MQNFTCIPKCVKGKLYDRVPRSPLPYFEIPVEMHVSLKSKKNVFLSHVITLVTQTELSLQTHHNIIVLRRCLE